LLRAKDISDHPLHECQVE